MECRIFEERLELFVAGNLPAEEKGAAEEHLGECARCRALLSLVRGDEPPAPRADEKLVLSILHTTSGAACSDAAPLLCDWIDACLPQDDCELLSLHLDHCQDCRTLAAALQELKECLPGMAEIEPDESFTDRVLAATVGLPRRDWHARPRLDFLQWWRRLVRRPRFAWEAAYIGALLFLPALGSPAWLALDAPEVTQVSRAVMRNGGQILQETAAALTERGKTATRSIRDLQVQTRSVLAATAESQGRTASAVRRKASSILERLMRNLSGVSPVKERPDLPQPQNQQQSQPAPNHRPA